MIQVAGLTYHYPRTAEPALDGLSFDVPAGQFCAVVGANGAGKSTLCYTLTGFIPHFFRGRLTGSVTVAGQPVANTPLAELAGVASLVFANPFNQISGARFTVREEIAFGLENLGLPRDEMLHRIDEALALTGLNGLADRAPLALSGGQQQRLALASVLAMRPPLLVLDEPTSQLDPVGTRELFTVLHELAADDQTTIVLVSHKIEWVAVFADRVLVLGNGRLLADGPPRQILARADLGQAGMGLTRYTQVARQARAEQLVDAARPLPVTLEQAVEYFDEYRR